MTVEEFREYIEVYHTEMEFRYNGVHYFVSDNFSEGIFIGGPNQEEFVQTVDEALDRLIVDGKPLREMTELVDWD